MFKLESSLETVKITKTALEAAINKIDADMQALVARKHILVYDLEQIDLKLAELEPQSVDHLQLPAPTSNGNGNLVVVHEKVYPKKYNEDWNLRRKMQYVIYKTGIPLTSDEIKEKLLKHEPNIDLTNVSAYLSQGVKNGAFIRHNINGSKPKYEIGNFVE